MLSKNIDPKMTLILSTYGTKKKKTKMNTFFCSILNFLGLFFLDTVSFLCGKSDAFSEIVVHNWTWFAKKKIPSECSHKIWHCPLHYNRIGHNELNSLHNRYRQTNRVKLNKINEMQQLTIVCCWVHNVPISSIVNYTQFICMQLYPSISNNKAVVFRTSIGHCIIRYNGTAVVFIKDHNRFSVWLITIKFPFNQ